MHPFLDSRQSKFVEKRPENTLQVNIAFVYVIADLLLLELHQQIHGIPDGLFRLKLLLRVIN